MTFLILWGGGTCSHIYNTEAIKEIINFTPKKYNIFTTKIYKIYYQKTYQREKTP